MKLLAIESATEICSVAYLENGKTTAVVEENIPRQHAEKLPLFYQRLAQEIDLNLAELDGIALSIGPGSFTGLRIGLSFAKGLAYGYNLSLIPVPTLFAIVSGVDSPGNKLKMVLYSHRDKVFIQEFRRLESGFIPLGNPAATTWNNASGQQAGDFKLAQWGCDKLIESGTKNILPAKPSAVLVGKLATDFFDDWVMTEPFELVPDYISPFEMGK